MKLDLAGVPKQAESRATFSLKHCLFPQDCGCGEASTLQCSYSDNLNKSVEVGPVLGWEACVDCDNLFGRRSYEATPASQKEGAEQLKRRGCFLFWFKTFK